MNVLIISPTQLGIGGISQHIQGLKNFLEKHEHKVEIISSENTFTIPIKGLKNPSFMNNDDGPKQFVLVYEVNKNYLQFDPIN